MYFAISIDPYDPDDNGQACFFETLERALTFKKTWESEGLIVHIFHGKEIKN